MQGVIFIGLQASGKSTFYADRFAKTHLRLNLDMMKTRHREKILFNACLQAKQPVVIDNTNPTKKDRQRYIPGLKQHQFEVHGYFFQSSIKSCLQRNELREGKECIPEKGVRATFKQLEMPNLGEGFDKLYFVSMTEDGFVVEEWKDEV